MDKKDIEKLQADARRGIEEANRRMDAYYTEMRRLEITLRMDYEDNNGKIDYQLQIDENKRKREGLRKEILRAEEEEASARNEIKNVNKQPQQQHHRRVQGQYRVSLQSYRRNHCDRLENHQYHDKKCQELEEMEKNKKTIPKIPSLAAISPRLRLESKNFRNDEAALPDKHYEKLMFQELMQRRLGSYITHQPTSGYRKATPEIQGLRGLRARELLGQVHTESSTKRRMQLNDDTTATTQPKSTLRTELLQLAHQAEHEGHERLGMARRASTST
eukprot:3622526-Amphidinium_carterae.1